jgi:hypothetical protein
MQARVGIAIDDGNHLADRPIACADPLQHCPLAHPAMSAKAAQELAGLAHGSAMAREIKVVVAIEQSVERGHVFRHRSIRRCDDRCRPGHDVVCGEDDAGVLQREGAVIGGVTGRVERAQTPAVALDDLVIRQLAIRAEVQIGGFLEGIDLSDIERPGGAMGAFGPRSRRRSPRQGVVPAASDRGGYG